MTNPLGARPQSGTVQVGPFELLRSEFDAMATAVARDLPPTDSIRLTLAADGSCRAWISDAEPPTVSTGLIRAAN